MQKCYINNKEAMDRQYIAFGQDIGSHITHILPPHSFTGLVDVLCLERGDLHYLSHHAIGIYFSTNLVHNDAIVGYKTSPLGHRFVCL